MGRRPPSGSTAAALDLLDRARATLLLACRAESTTDRYIHAHLGALRAAAAVLAARPVRRRGGVGNVWECLTDAAPELREWSEYFAVLARRRSALEAGSVRVSVRECDDVLRAAETFVCLAHAALGMPVAVSDPPLSAVTVR